MRRIWRFIVDEDGPTAVEYAVLLALIIVVTIGGIRAFSDSTNTSLQYSGDQIDVFMNGSSGGGS